MRGEEGPAAFQCGFPICLESIRDVVMWNLEDHSHEKIDDAIKQELYPGVINHRTAVDEATSEDAIPSLIEKRPVTHDIAAIVRFVGHHDHNGIALAEVDTFDDGSAKAVGVIVFDRAKRRIRGG